MSKFTLADGTASIDGEIGLLTEKEYTIPMSKKDTTESLKTALYELLVYADTVRSQNNSIVELANKSTKEIKQLKAERDGMRESYNGLIMAVAHKWPNESRHETALRYIRQAESSDNCCVQEALSEGELNVDY